MIPIKNGIPRGNVHTTYRKVVVLAVRITLPQFLALEKQAEAEGRAIPNLVRRRLFGSK
jgi:hypothetical protein